MGVLLVAEGHVVLRLVFRKEDDAWTGECLELGTATCGDTLEQVHAELAELVELHLHALEKAGELGRFLKANNVKFYAAGQITPRSINHDVPVDESSFVHAHLVPVGLHV
jgi:predicted RNase H-like HicB family nuclease